jgi:DNA gyrase subunit A
VGIVPAPDFPTGGQILGLSGARSLYTTGHGSVALRARCHVEVLSPPSAAAVTAGVEGKPGATTGRTRTAIVVTELPYMTNKAGEYNLRLANLALSKLPRHAMQHQFVLRLRCLSMPHASCMLVISNVSPVPCLALLEKIADLVNDKKLEGISDLRDETDRDGLRMVIELKRDAIPAVVQNNLFKHTALQTSFSGNMLALVREGAQPKRITLKEALSEFLSFRCVFLCVAMCGCCGSFGMQ